MPDYDVIVVGAGHAGMMTATYLARAGLDVLILKKGLEVGGDMTTESFAYPGFWHNIHSYYHLGVDRLAPFRDACVEQFKEVADLSRGTILDAEVISPADIDRHVGNLDKGAVHMGEIIYRRDEYFSRVPELASYRTPIEGLYYCGLCTHPGGDVVGATAYHTVNVIADDLGIDLWWKPLNFEEHLSGLK
ncbi:MAG: FAD-dependent oxidoreductase [Nitrospinota bacterium]|nr:FAD-dependent oxidoreductase [Nitrospinota bacterium]MDP6618074.1 FAD-dependent oxidoreductase [Nitrospinota bacterium]